MSLPINSRIADEDDVAPTLQAAKSENRGGTEGPLVCVSGASSAESAAWTKDSDAPDTPTPSSVSPTRTGETCSEHGSPESPSTTTYAFFDPSRTLMPDGTIMENWEEHEIANAITSPSGTKSPLVIETYMEDSGQSWTELAPTLRAVGNNGGREGSKPLIFSAAGSRAKTCPSPDDEPDSTVPEVASSSSSPASLSLFDPDGYSSRTYPDCSPRTAVGTSESCLERWPTSGTAWRGGFSTHVSSECRSAAGECSSLEPSLTEILEPPQSVPGRYSLSARAAQGILRRAQRRGKTLPEHLEQALHGVAHPAEAA